MSAERSDVATAVADAFQVPRMNAMVSAEVQKWTQVVNDAKLPRL